MKLKEEISSILGIRVEKGGYQKVFQDIDLHGAPNRKQVNKILIALLERVEKLEENSGQNTSI